ncbi:ATP-dependent RNA helicase DDX24-like [Eriocheir sinensis]|uniref:ATP-dependent RNA helicase DDX24-like n=1 Tax=Eriocheir sinensis TaxID=95602 RepID=UPI0021CACC2E|nr:ATP-dependent RNA helicase DDX24-like [Eriocheir sinensis]
MGKKQKKTPKITGEGKNKTALLSAPVEASHEFEGLAGFEELSTCTLIKMSKRGEITREMWQDGKIVKKKRKNKKKKQNTKKKNKEDTAKLVESKLISDVSDEELDEESKTKSSNKRKKQRNPSDKGDQTGKKARYDSTTYHGAQHGMAAKVDVSAWKEVFAPLPVLEALADLGFSQPTEIQKLVLPAAIKDRLDIIGAAETGSGKTLAFGIPIIHGILTDKSHEMEHSPAEAADSGLEDSEQEAEDCDADQECLGSGSDVEEDICDNDDQSESSDDIDANVSDIEDVNDMNEEMGCVKVIDNADFSFMEENDQETTKNPSKKLRALIVTPTRELAIQIKNHLCAVLTHTDITIAVVMGGVAPQKQERLLRQGPDIVVGTPGRLWELIQQGNEHLSQLYTLKYLAIDETDRMVEQGHFQELTQLLELINSNENAKQQRQTFVFSATLTMVHSAPKRMHMKKKVVKMTPTVKINQLTKLIGVKSHPKIVDVTRKFGTAQSLTEARINCDKDEKDLYLYYFLKCYPGRTLVFCNSIDCVRRLQNLFTLLQCQPQSLHASLQQKQRLKSLERFSNSPQALLLATDVAARGLDIPNIQHVIHYQVPRTAETYVHRSGRTARAQQEGLSVLLIESSEIKKYRQLCVTLNRATDLPPFPVDSNIMSQVKKRLDLARTLEIMEHRIRKTNANNEWFRRAAEEADILIDEDILDPDEEREKSMKTAQEKRELKNKRKILMKMLSTPFMSSDFSGKYPTQTGSLVTYSIGMNFDTSTKQENNDSNNALSVMKKESKDFQKLVKTIKNRIPKKKINKKKFKGFEKRKLKQKKSLANDT